MDWAYKPNKEGRKAFKILTSKPTRTILLGVDGRIILEYVGVSARNGLMMSLRRIIEEIL